MVVFYCIGDQVAQNDLHLTPVSPYKAVLRYVSMNFHALLSCHWLNSVYDTFSHLVQVNISDMAVFLPCFYLRQVNQVSYKCTHSLQPLHAPLKHAPVIFNRVARLLVKNNPYVTFYCVDGRFKLMR
jgi:hypothetical protein